MSIRYLSLLALALVGNLLWPAPLHAEDEVKIGVNDLLSDAPFHIAQQKGFFKQQGITISFVHFDTGPQMIAPLARGDLDVGAGALSAGLYNAVARGIDIKVVADKGSTTAIASYVPLTIRKALIDSGRVKTYADLKGLRIGEAGKWAVQASTVNEALKKGGLTFADAVNVFNISNPQQVTAMANDSLDGGITTEPLATIAVRKGIAVRFSTPSLYPNQQIAALLYGGGFIKNRPQVATKFMIAYLQAIRIYNDALVDGRFAGPGSDEVIDIITRRTTVQDKSLFKDMYANGCNPDGRVYIDSMRRDFAFLKSQGVIEGNITADTAIDDRFVEQALAVLGPYRSKR